MKIKILFILFITLILFSVVSAEESGGILLGKNGDCIELPQESPSSTFAKLTKVQYPNLSVEIIDTLMTKNGTSYNYTFCNTNANGDYSYCTLTDVDSIDTIACKPFEITQSGTSIDTGSSIIYIILASGVFILFSLSFYFMVVVPYSNRANEKGAVIQVVKLKYVKLGLILLTWVLFVWFLNILIGLSDNFVNLTMYYGFFSFMFEVMNKISLPLSIVILIIAGIEIIRDTNIQKEIAKFGSASR